MLSTKEKYTLCMTPHRRAIGNKGEELAVEYLMQHGYAIMERNVTFQGGEIDIIATHD